MIFNLFDIAWTGVFYIGIYTLADISDPISFESLLCLILAYALYYVVTLICEALATCFLLDPTEQDEYLEEITDDEFGTEEEEE